MTKIQLRRDTSTNWTQNNPIPAQGEPCYETDTGKLKIGNGTQNYNDLSYINGSSSGGTDDYNDLRNIPQINGVELKGNLTSADLNISINTISINGGGAESTNYITYYTKVGNPNISEDFIMTGASQSNYLNCDFKPPSAINSFIFEGEFVVSENAILEASHQAIFGQQVDTTNRTSPQLEVVTNPDTSSQGNNQIGFLPPVSSSSWGDTIRHYITDISKFPGTWYYKYTFDVQSQTVIGHIENMTNGYKPDDITISQSIVYWISPLSIGADSGAEHTSNNISIDLKSFKVNINDSVINYQAIQIL